MSSLYLFISNEGSCIHMLYEAISVLQVTTDDYVIMSELK